MRSFKKMWTIARVIWFWYSAVSAVIFFIAAVAAPFGEAGGIAGSLLEYAIGKDFLDKFPKEYFTVCVILACFSLCTTNVLCCVVLKRKEGAMMRRQIKVAALHLFCWALAATCFVLELALISVAFIGGLVVLCSGAVCKESGLVFVPCVLAAIFMWYIGYLFYHHAEIMPARWNSFLHDAIDRYACH